MRHSKPVRLGNRTYRGSESVYLSLQFTIMKPYVIELQGGWLTMANNKSATPHFLCEFY